MTSDEPLTSDPDDAPAGVPRRAVLLSAALLWLFYFVMTTLRGALLGLEYQNAMLAPRLIVSLAGVAVTLIMYLLIRPFDARPLGVRIAVMLIAAMPASVVLAHINGVAFSGVEQRHVAAKGARSGVTVILNESGGILVEAPNDPEVPEPAAPPAPPVPPTTSAVTGSAATGPAGPPAPSPPPAPPQPGAQTSGAGQAEGARVIINPKAGSSHSAGAVVVRTGKAETDTTEMSNWKEITDIALSRYFLLVAWAALYQALLAGERARGAQQREDEFRRAAKAAELRSLRYQVNPHFLFNTLNSLSALVMTGKADMAEAMIQNLSRFYRRSLTQDPTGDVPLAEEFAQQRLYLEIEMVRFPQRLRADFDLPEELAQACVPGLILQPLVENSVKYAVAPTSAVVTIRVAARREGDRLVLTVSDDGIAKEADHRPERTGVMPGHGIGLANVRQRLHARFGDEAGVASGRTARGYVTTIILPLI